MGNIFNMPRPKEEPQLTTAQRNLKALIEHSGKSTNAWAVEYKLDQSTISRILRGKQDPGSALMERIASHAGFHAWWLLVLNFDPSNPPLMREQTPTEAKLYARVRAAIDVLREIPVAPDDKASK